MESLFRIPITRDARGSTARIARSTRRKAGRSIVQSRCGGDAWDIVPDLTVEVVGPPDLAEDPLGKVGESFQAVVRLVWVVYPIRRCIHVYEARDRIRVVTETDELDGGEALPGFCRSLDRLFGPVATEPEESS